MDLEYTVGPDGHPGNIKVQDAMPRGVFEHAAEAAVLAARYQPLPKNVAQVSRPARQRVTFKLTQ